MQRTASGYHVVEIDGIGPGDRYHFRLDGGRDRPDPASRCQPQGVHGPSQVVRRDFPWTDQAWTGVRLRDLIIYELHVGTFTDDGTFQSAMDRLDELVELGVTAIELMPVAEAAGLWNWGYDGVCLFAPNHNYGTPEALKRLVDAAHSKGLAVVLDVVYNHLGPEGNYLSEFGPYFSSKHSTPWGDAPNFDDAIHDQHVRRFFIANAVYWFDEFHFDALRVDAIHCTKDDSDPHIVSEISSAVETWSEETGRTTALIAESNVYDPVMLESRSNGGIGFDAQWCDDFLHSVFAVVRPGEQLCHRKYKPHTDLDQTLCCGYIFEGTFDRQPTRQRAPSRIDTSGLVYSIQNHDFIGNHPQGERFHNLTSIETQKAAAALLLLSPAIPMLFMGEEFACDNPFRFFVDFEDQQLRDAVVEGRRREYPQHDWSLGLMPTDEQTFRKSKIGEVRRGDTEMWTWYQSLIGLRHEWINSGLLSDQNLSIDNDLDHGLFRLSYESANQVATVAVRLNAELTINDQHAMTGEGTVILNSRQSQTDGTKLHCNHAVVRIANKAK